MHCKHLLIKKSNYSQHENCFKRLLVSQCVAYAYKMQSCDASCLYLDFWDVYQLLFNFPHLLGESFPVTDTKYNECSLKTQW